MTKGASSPAAPTKEGGQRRDLIPTEPGWYIAGVQPYEGRKPPRSVIHLGGVAFIEVAYDENPTIKADTIEFNQARRGQRVYLDKWDLDALRAAMGKKIVRVRSEKTGVCVILSKDSRAAQRPLKHDLPLEKFCYLVSAEAPKTDEEGIVREDVETHTPIA